MILYLVLIRSICCFSYYYCLGHLSGSNSLSDYAAFDSL